MASRTSREAYRDEQARSAYSPADAGSTETTCYSSERVPVYDVEAKLRHQDCQQETLGEVDHEARPTSNRSRACLRSGFTRRQRLRSRSSTQSDGPDAAGRRRAYRGANGE